MDNNMIIKPGLQNEKFSQIINEITNIENDCEKQFGSIKIKQLADGRIQPEFDTNPDSRISYLHEKLNNTKEPLVKRYLLTEISTLCGLSGKFDQITNYLAQALNTYAPDSNDFFNFCNKQAHEKVQAQVNNGTKDKESLNSVIFDDRITGISSRITTKKLKENNCYQLIMQGEYGACEKLIFSGKYIKFNDTTKARLQEYLLAHQEKDGLSNPRLRNVNEISNPGDRMLG